MIATAITRMLEIRYPVLAAPMFLISNVEMLVAVGEAGGLASVPSLNYRSSDQFREAIRTLKQRTTAPFGVNLILLGNPRLEADLRICLEERVPLLITSLGNPQPVIEAAHAHGARVFCDVTNAHHAKKAEAAGADAVIAVSAGAGGHAGTLSPMALIPYLVEQLRIPVVAAGAISDGRGLAAALALGAQAAYMGTRFIASQEAPAAAAYKEMILAARPDDIVYSPEVSGHPANFLGSSLEAFRASRQGEAADAPVQPSAWKDVWSAGHGVGTIDRVESCREIVEGVVAQYLETLKGLPGSSSAGRFSP